MEHWKSSHNPYPPPYTRHRGHQDLYYSRSTIAPDDTHRGHHNNRISTIF
jgi:hypothetical protein